MNECFSPQAFRKKKACVLGLGKSGVAAARLLKRRGFSVFGSDTRKRVEVQKALGRLGTGISWEANGHTKRILKSAFAVKSPGLSPSAPVFSRLEQAHIPVFSELEIALAFCRSQNIVAITGTNGKTTTAALTAAIFHEALPKGRRSHLGGNIGIPLSDFVEQAKPKDVLILEASSYQLEDSRCFKPKAAALLNITPDHLDHHGGMQKYMQAKSRIFSQQGESDFCVFNAQDPLVLKLSRSCPSRKLYFGLKGGRHHAWVDAGKIRVKLPGKKEIALTPPNLPGVHNLDNAMAAVLLAMGWGLKPSAIQKALKKFKGVEHRLEEAGTVKGLRCINDSKATNVDSTLVALKVFSRKNVLLILGGQHKGSPYTPLRPLIDSVVKGILTIGSAADKIEEDLRALVPILPCQDLQTAVATAFQIASPGDILLLSPACASFDQFKNFEDRGAKFKALVDASGRKSHAA